MPRPLTPDALFSARRRIDPPRFDEDIPRGTRVFALAGIADPAPFFAEVRVHGTVVGQRVVRDHHAFSVSEVRELFVAARAAGADAVITTEKDYVRLLPYRPFALPVGYLPLTMEVEPLDEFRAWLAGSLADARDHVVV